MQRGLQPSEMSEAQRVIVDAVSGMGAVDFSVEQAFCSKLETFVATNPQHVEARELLDILGRSNRRWEQFAATANDPDARVRILLRHVEDGCVYTTATDSRLVNELTSFAYREMRAILISGLNISLSEGRRGLALSLRAAACSTIGASRGLRSNGAFLVWALAASECLSTHLPLDSVAEARKVQMMGYLGMRTVWEDRKSVV